MSNKEPNHNQSDCTVPSTKSSQDIKQQVESKLQDANLRAKRSVPIVDGQKCPQRGETNHQNPDNHRHPNAIDGNCSLHTGDGLVAIDIDDHNAFPDEIKSRLPDTYTIKTPHGGEHLLYNLPDDTDIGTADLPNDSGDLQYNGVYILCPGSYINHSDCDDNKQGCPGQDTGQYLPNNQPIATITESKHPNLLKWMRNLGSKGNSKSASSESTSPTPEQELNDIDLNNGESQAERFYKCLEDKIGNEACKAIDDVLKGGDADIIDSSDDSTIDRSRADYYALKRLYGAFSLHYKDKPPEARQNALDTFAYFIEEYPYHSDGQERKANTRKNRQRYLNNTISNVQAQFESGGWFYWARWEGRNKRHQSRQSSGASPLTKVTVFAAIEYLSFLGSGLHISIETLQRRYWAYFEKVNKDEAISQLPSYPPTPPLCSSPYPPGRITPPSDSTVHPNQVRTGSADKQIKKKATDRMFPTRKEITKMAHLLNPDRARATFADALSELVHDPEPTETVVKADCRFRKSRNRFVYYLQDPIAGYKDPSDAEYVELEDQEFQPGTREWISPTAIPSNAVLLRRRSNICSPANQ